MLIKASKKGLMKSSLKHREVEQKTTKETSSKEKGTSRLAKDEYTPMFPPIRFLVRETPSRKDPTKKVKQYVEMKVQRFDDDEAMPNVWVSMYQESELYTGYLKGKNINFPLEMLYDVIENLQELSDECENRKIEC